MRPRNPYSLHARRRKAGPHKDRRTKRDKGVKGAIEVSQVENGYDDWFWDDYDCDCPDCSPTYDTKCVNCKENLAGTDGTCSELCATEWFMTHSRDEDPEPPF